MSVVVIDGCMVRDFVEDREAFEKAVQVRFQQLDRDHDGVLSPYELRRDIEKLEWHPEEEEEEKEVKLSLDTLFQQFDADHDGSVDIAEFGIQMRSMMMGIAEGLGYVPLQMLLPDQASSLYDVVAHHHK